MARIDSTVEEAASSSPSAVDRASEAREAGNVSYKKGKWAEAIGHYTTSTLLNPSDPAPLLNRAQAYLKLEKWRDAQRDCSTVLALPSQSRNVKALFRRALARKELGEKSTAAADLELILAIEPGNGAAREELQEVTKTTGKDGRPSAKKPVSASAKSSTPAATIKGKPTTSGSSATAKPIGTKQRTMTAIPITVVPRFTEDTVTTPVASTAEAGPSTFAEKKAKREKKSFAVPPVPSPSRNTDIPFISSAPSTSPQSSPATILTPSRPPPLPSSSHTKPAADADVIMRSTASSSAPSPIRSEARTRKSRSSAKPPSSGMELFARLEVIRSDEEGWEILRTLEPSRLALLVGNIVEPDNLAALIHVMHSVLATGVAETKEDVKDYMVALRGMKRWTMTSLMLSGEEGRMMDEVWESCN